MDTSLKIPDITKIISFLTPPGEPWDKEEFHSSIHPNNREILIALQGSCRYMMNNSVYTFTPGTAGLISPGCLHAAAYTVHDHDLLHLWVHFSNSLGMHGILLRVTEEGRFGKVHFQRNPVYFPGSVEQLTVKRWKMLEQCSDEKMNILLMQLPCQLILNEFYLQWEGLQPVLRESSLSSFLQSYIRSRLGSGCTISRLSELSGYSSSHISHVFQQETGESIGAFINRVRIAHTRDALQQGVPQKVIAGELGFSSASSFWNWMQSIPELKKK